MLAGQIIFSQDAYWNTICKENRTGNVLTRFVLLEDINAVSACQRRPSGFSKKRGGVNFNAGKAV